jgi:hypothetical protein
MLISISNQTKLVAFINYRRLEIKQKGGLRKLRSYTYIAYFLTQKKEMCG